MPLMMWSNDYSVHIEIVDEQHRKIIELINRLHDAMKLGKGKDTLGKTLSELVDYTSYHFNEEEELFKVYGYPDYPPHKREHDALTRQVLNLKERFASGNTFLSNETLLFLKDWLNDHILGVDKKYSSFMTARGVS